MSSEYIEVGSAYRNRVQFPNPSSFIVQVSQSGNKVAATAVDPVSLATPISVFTPFTQLSGTLMPAATSFSYAAGIYDIVIGIAVGQAASRVLDFYSGIDILFTNAAGLPGTERHRIKYWRYSQTVGGLDIFTVMIYSPLTNTAQAGNTTFTMDDPTSLQDPANLLLYLPASISTPNYYINSKIFNQTLNQWQNIDYYDGQNHVAHLDSASGSYTPGTWLLAHTYVLRSQIPIQYGNTIQAGTTVSDIVIVPTIGMSYVGSFIRVLNTNLIRRIISFAVATARVSPAFPAIPAGAYEILQFSYDNESYLTFNNSFAAIREAVCYDVSLVNIVLPNFVLNSSMGSRAIFYPYIYVQWQSEKNSDRQGVNSITSNNPNATRMLFRALVNDSTETDRSPFVRLDGNGMIQRIKLDPQGSYTFSVHLPDGSLFQTIAPERYSPLPPNPLVQISAIFSFQRVE
jgi:hypothetical protein